MLFGPGLKALFFLPTRIRKKKEKKHMPITNSPSILTLLKNNCKSIVEVQQVHARIIRKGLEQDHYLVSHLLDSRPLSLSASSLLYCASIFHRLSAPSAIHCNILLKKYSKSEAHAHCALSLFIHMKRDGGATPDGYSYVSVVEACANRKREGECVHGSAIRCGTYADAFVGSTLVNFYGKLMEVGSAQKVFDGMFERNVVSWTSLIYGYLNVGNLKNALRLFEQMPESNLVTWNTIITSLVKDVKLDGARKLFDKMPEKDVVSFTVLIDGYAKAGDLSSARALFEEAPKKDVVAWTSLITGYSRNGQPDEAIDMFRRMVSVGILPDKHMMVSFMSACSKVGNLELVKWVESYLCTSSIDIGQPYVVAALIDMNAKCGNMDRAQRLFDEMPQRDMIVYCSMIQGYSIHGQVDLALCLFDRMLEEGFVPDEVAFMVILMACSRGGRIDESLKYFELLKNRYSIVPTPNHYVCIIDLLGRAGRLKEAYKLLKSMPVEPHASAWGALLGACKLFDDVKLGEIVANQLIEAQPKNADSYVALSNIYAASNKWLDVSSVRDMMKERGITKVPGSSWGLV